MIPLIRCHVASDKSTIDYVRFMWETMRSLANHPEALSLIIHSIGPTASDRLKSLPEAQAYEVNVSPDSVSGSAAHGACVEHALAMTDDGTINIIVDSDTVVVARGWDDYVRIKLLNDGIGMIGSAAEDIGGFSSGTGMVQMAKKIPTMTWCALSPLHRWRNLKAAPNKDAVTSIDTDELSSIYNLPVGYKAFRDVGWQIPQYLHDHGISYMAWQQLKPSKSALILRGFNDYHEEYHAEEGVPILLHQRGSLRHAYRGEGSMSKSFYVAADAYLEQERARAETRWTFEPNERARAVLADLVTVKPGSASPIPRPTNVQAVDGYLKGDVGWLKASLNGNVVWSRHNKLTPRTLAVNLEQRRHCQNLRLEGTLVEPYQVQLPTCINAPYNVTLRNLLPVNVVVRTDEQRREALTVTVPSSACWSLLVDIDGVIHVA